MLKVLVPVDGSDPSKRAIDHLIATPQYRDGADIHLINVQAPLPGRAAAAVGHSNVEDYHREEGMKAMHDSQQRLDAAGVKYHCHIAVGEAAKVIVDYARQHAIEQIVMGTHGRNAVASALMGSVAKEVLNSAHIPVLLVK
jgi:nucleotide-binding universal stress UspA family protein